ncbi:MAG: hypothetical protein Q9218_003806 [Villophora microphyllina]
MTVSKLEIWDGGSATSFISPSKQINEGHNVLRFFRSKAYRDIMIFMLQLNRAMFPCCRSNLDKEDQMIQTWGIDSANVTFSETVRQIRALLTELNAVIDEVPPDPGPRRFGNVSFRRWYEIIEARSQTLLNHHVPTKVLSFMKTSNVGPYDELRSYLLGSFGSSQRLDYGTGHELSFLAFLGCIWKLGGFENSTSGNEERGIVLGVLEPYLQLIRRLIKTYTLEPAGSHGVWGLDDHSFLPYLFGSAQYSPAISDTDDTPVEGSLMNAPSPADVTKLATVQRERVTNMYFSAIGFIYDVKKGPFWEHSPMLYDISGVRGSWAKINKGMIKMYVAEVLSKFPVVQHFYFGSLFSWDEDPEAVSLPNTIHISNQPSQQLSKLPAIDSDRVASVQQGNTKVPVVSTASAASSPFVGTAAPWAKRSTVTSPTLAFPSQTEQRNISQTPRSYGQDVKDSKGCQVNKAFPALHSSYGQDITDSAAPVRKDIKTGKKSESLAYQSSQDLSQSVMAPSIFVAPVNEALPSSTASSVSSIVKPTQVATTVQMSALWENGKSSCVFMSFLLFLMLSSFCYVLLQLGRFDAGISNIKPRRSDKNMKCGFTGDADIYGIGIRIGYYTQAVSVWFANYFVASQSPTLRSVNALFMFALLIGLIWFSRVPSDVFAVEAWLLNQLLAATWFVGVVNDSRFSKKYQRYDPARSVIQDLSFFTLLGYMAWYYWFGLDRMKKTPCGTYVLFIFLKVDLLGWYRSMAKILTFFALPMGFKHFARTSSRIIHHFWTRTLRSPAFARKLLAELKSHQAIQGNNKDCPCESKPSEIAQTIPCYLEDRRSRGEERPSEEADPIFEAAKHTPLPPSPSLNPEQLQSPRLSAPNTISEMASAPSIPSLSSLLAADAYIDSVLAGFEQGKFFSTHRIPHTPVRIICPKIRWLTPAYTINLLNHMFRKRHRPDIIAPLFIYLLESHTYSHHLLADIFNTAVDHPDYHTVSKDALNVVLIFRMLRLPHCNPRVAIELGIVWNRVEGLGDMGKVGQLVPAVLGVGGLVKVGWARWRERGFGSGDEHSVEAEGVDEGMRKCGQAYESLREKRTEQVPEQEQRKSPNLDTVSLLLPGLFSAYCTHLYKPQGSTIQRMAPSVIPDPPARIPSTPLPYPHHRRELQVYQPIQISYEPYIVWRGSHKIFGPFIATSPRPVIPSVRSAWYCARHLTYDVAADAFRSYSQILLAELTQVFGDKIVFIIMIGHYHIRLHDCGSIGDELTEGQWVLRVRIVIEEEADIEQFEDAARALEEEAEERGFQMNVKVRELSSPEA